MDEVLTYTRRIIPKTETEFSLGPDNAYVTEDTLILYVAEDGTTFYVPES